MQAGVLELTPTETGITSGWVGLFILLLDIYLRLYIVKLKIWSYIFVILRFISLT